MSDYNTQGNFSSSQLETVDLAIYEWLNEKMNIFCNTSEGWNKVPITWVSAERSFQIKNNKDLRDERGTLIMPLMVVERTGINKSNDSRGAYFNSIPNVSDDYVITKTINHKKTAEFTNADSLYNNSHDNYREADRNKNNTNVVYVYKKIQRPIYVTMDYKISVMSQYQQQMNEIIQPFIVFTGSQRYFIAEKDGHRFEVFIDPAFAQSNNLDTLESEERRYITNITLKVYANLVGLGSNDDSPLFKTVENAVKVKISKESVIFPKKT